MPAILKRSNYMDKYISREAMLKNLTADLEHHSDEGDPRTVIVTQLFIKYVEGFPSADVQPVVHAYWIELPKALNPNENPCKCSNCGHILSFMNGYPKSKYCDECGARMDLNAVTYDRCSNYMDCDGNCFIDDTTCDCDGNIEKCKGRCGK